MWVVTVAAYYCLSKTLGVVALYCFYARKHAECWLETLDDSSGRGGHLGVDVCLRGVVGRGKDAVRENPVGRDLPRMLRRL